MTLGSTTDLVPLSSAPASIDFGDRADQAGFDQALVLPALFRRDSPETITRALEFFRVTLANPGTRVQYQQSVAVFCRWISESGHGVTSLRDVQPIHVAGYVAERRSNVAAPTVTANKRPGNTPDWL